MLTVIMESSQSGIPKGCQSILAGILVGASVQDVTLQAGDAYFRCGDYNAAAAEYKAGLGMAQSDQTQLKLKLHCSHADAMAALGRHTEAIMDCCAAVELDPSYLKAYQLRAEAAAVCAVQVSIAVTAHQCDIRNLCIGRHVWRHQRHAYRSSGRANFSIELSKPLCSQTSGDEGRHV